MASPDDRREDDVVRVREILDEHDEEKAVRGADLQTSITVAGMSVPLVFGGPVGAVTAAIFGGVVSAYDARKQARFGVRIEATVREIVRRLEHLGDYVDMNFVSNEEFLEMADEVFERVARQRNEDKRHLYATILANTARLDVDRSFYPIALKLLDVIEPVHVDILRELLLGTVGQKVAGGMQKSSTRDLGLSLHLEELEDMRMARLSKEVPEVFDVQPKGVAAWEAAIHKVASSKKPSVRTLIDAAQVWDYEVYDHVLYLAKEGLVADPASARHTSINELGERLLDWLAEPED